MRIDAHVHYTPPELAASLPVLSVRETYWGQIFSGCEDQGWVTPERMLDDMDRAGIDKVVIQGNYWRHHDTCVDRNSEVLDLLARWPDRFIGFATLQPQAGHLALDELMRCLDGGMRGVGELGVYGMGIGAEDAGLCRLAETCIERDIPLCLHVSEEVGHFYPGKSTTPLASYYELACQFPELKLILAHWGGGLIFYELMPEVRRAMRNVWYDTAASPLLYPTSAIFRIALQSVDHQKILYGSDYPLRICRQKQKTADFEPFVAEIDALSIDPVQYSDIMGANAARLFCLPGVPARPAASNEDERPTKGIQVITKVDAKANPAITESMAVRIVANAWPVTRSVFEQFGIPWQDCPVPFWEPIGQSAAARGCNDERRRLLLEALNEAVRS